jgi:hypothetical protein
MLIAAFFLLVLGKLYIMKDQYADEKLKASLKEEYAREKNNKSNDMYFARLIAKPQEELTPDELIYLNYRVNIQSRQHLKSIKAHLIFYTACIIISVIVAFAISIS